MTSALARRVARHSLPRFLVVGASNTLISYVLFVACVSALAGHGARGALAQVVSYAGGMAWSYVWNRRWSFRSANRAGSETVRFAAVQLAMLGASVGLVHLAVDRLGLPPTPSWIAVVGPLTAANYLLLRTWVFAGRDRPHC